MTETEIATAPGVEKVETASRAMSRKLLTPPSPRVGEPSPQKNQTPTTTSRPPAVLLPSPDAPIRVARALERNWRSPDGDLALRHWREQWYRWTGSHWSEITDSDMRAWLWQRLADAQFLFKDGRSGVETRRAWNPTRGRIANVTEALQAITNLRADVELGWLDDRPDPGIIIPCRNGLLSLKSRTLLPPTAKYFNTSAVPFDYDAKAPAPVRWLAFLDSVWRDDPESIETLQECFGYTVSGDRRFEKLFLLVGPTRSGKGTISTVLKALVGEEHAAAPTLAGLATNFGLSPLLGKSLAIIPDARMPREHAGLIVERLLMISGRDPVTVDRKHRDPWTGVIPVQFFILSNELPALPDAAAAIVGRLLTLCMTESFYGKEDPNLKTALLAELPGILNWALVGLDRLMERGHFVEPKSSTEAASILRRTSSPMKTFLDERCVVEAEASVPKEKLWDAYRAWCNAGGRDNVGTVETFSRALFAAAPKVKSCRPREYPGGPQINAYQGLRLK